MLTPEKRNFKYNAIINNPAGVSTNLHRHKYNTRPNYNRHYEVENLHKELSDVPYSKI